jgi:hypothetical protein
MGETHILVPENNNWLGSIMSVERTETMSQQQGPRIIPRVPLDMPIIQCLINLYTDIQVERGVESHCRNKLKRWILRYN